MAMHNLTPFMPDVPSGPVRETPEQEAAKLAWLKKAAEEAFAEIDAGKGITVNSFEQLDTLLSRLEQEAFAEVEGG